MKTVIQVDIYCLKCKSSVLKTITSFTGVNKVEANVERNTVTVIGDFDPFAVVKKLRKSRRTAKIVSAGPEKEEAPEKEKQEKKADPIPCTCQMCDTVHLSLETTGWSGQSCAVL